MDAFDQLLLGRGRRVLVGGACTVLVLAGCTGRGGDDDSVVGPSVTSSSGPIGPDVTTPVTTGPSDTTTTTTAASSGPPTSASAPPSSAPAPAGLRLAGADLGVTRVGAPFREGVAAVTAALGRPLADPANDTACIGAQDETQWAGFRLAGSGGKVSGWLSTSTSLSTPAGVKVGTTVAGLRQAYGATLEVRPPSGPGAVPVFVVKGAALGGLLTATAATGTVTALSNGSCEAQ